MINIINSEKPMMDVMTEEEVNILEQSVKLFRDKSLFISEINYKEGKIVIGYIYEDFTDNNILEINVSCESVGCMYYETIKTIFEEIER